MGYVLKMELRANVLVDDEPRPRWNHGIMPSKEADAAFHEAVDAFESVMVRHGYRGNYGYGSYASRLDA